MHETAESTYNEGLERLCRLLHVPIYRGNTVFARLVIRRLDHIVKYRGSRDSDVDRLDTLSECLQTRFQRGIQVRTRRSRVPCIDDGSWCREVNTEVGGESGECGNEG